MSDKLKPCPFCGSEKTPAHSPPSSDKKYNEVICTGCLAAGPPERNEQDAIAAWNRRAD